MRMPSLIDADHLQTFPCHTEIAPGDWAVSRQETSGPWWRRWVLAWQVFSGRYDAIRFRQK
jgi:hypothetical protein